MDTNSNNSRYEYQVMRGKTVNDLLFELEAWATDGWQPKLCLGQGIVLLERPFTGSALVLDDELGDINLTDEEPEDPLLAKIMKKYGPHTRRTD
jgi:hypothetical protein